MKARISSSLLFFAASLTLVGCKPDPAVKDGATIGKDTFGKAPTNSPSTNVADVDPTRAGTIVGTVHFKGDTPKRLKIDMSMDPACAMSEGDNLTEQYAVNDGKLANVYVYIKAGAPAAVASASMTVSLDQKGCRYIPHVIALQQGASVIFKNSDPTMHNVHIVAPGASGAMDVSQGPMGEPQTQQFTSPQVMLPVRCNNHPWMSAFINVSPTPYFAVTGVDGKFSIQGLPAGTYTLAAVHEKLGEQDIQITVPAKTTTKADFTFSGK
jgi:plastocyanin